MGRAVRPLSASQRRALSRDALRLATDLREELDLDDCAPGCPFDAALSIGLSVRFTDINMEGIYARDPRPIILVSSKRPYGRRVFNAAHELGHHMFGHGARLDELQERRTAKSWDDPEEFLADTFAGFFLMPVLAVESAFTRRGWSPPSASPLQVYIVACDFGVGYSTLVTHLAHGLSLISADCAGTLKATSPREVRKRLLGETVSSPLIVAGPNRTKTEIDLETGALLALPAGAIADTTHLAPVQSIANASLFRALAPGKTAVRAQGWRATVRIQRAGFVGLAKFRYLEDV